MEVIKSKDNFNEGEALNRAGHVASGLFKGQINPVTGEKYTYTGKASPGTIKVTASYSSQGNGTRHLSTVSNVVSVLGVHEFKGHGALGLSHNPADHRSIYQMQKNHPTFNKITEDYRQHIIDNLKK